MRPSSDQLAEVLTGSFKIRLIADVFAGAERTIFDLPVSPTSWSLKWDREARFKASGSLLVEYTSELADSLTPTEFTDRLAPFGPQLNLLLEVSAGSFSETIALGRYVLGRVPDARDEQMQVMGRDITIGSLVELEFQDQLLRIYRRGIAYEEQPLTAASRWDEIARLTGMQVARNTADAPVPDGVLYEPKQGGRLDAVQEHAAALGGVLYATSDNTLAIATAELTEPAVTLRVGDRGTLIDHKHQMDSEDVYNHVVGECDTEINGERITLRSEAKVESGPLVPSESGFWNTYYYTSKGATSQYAFDLEVQQVRDRLMRQRTYRVPVTCILDPRVTFVDTVEVDLGYRKIVGQVVTCSWGSNGLMQLELDVPKALPT